MLLFVIFRLRYGKPCFTDSRSKCILITFILRSWFKSKFTDTAVLGCQQSQIVCRRYGIFRTCPGTVYSSVGIDYGLLCSSTSGNNILLAIRRFRRYKDISIHTLSVRPSVAAAIPVHCDVWCKKVRRQIDKV